MKGFKRFAVFVMALAFLARLVAADVDRRLVEAAERQDTGAVRLLLKQHVDVNAPQADGATALAWAVHWNNLDMADLLIRAGASVNAANELGVAALWLACENGNAVMVDKLLAAGANPNATLLNGETPLMLAALTGSVPVVKALFAHSADANAKTTGRGGQTAIMWAVAEGHADVAQVLIETGADVNASSTGGFTPLLFAARVGDVRSARMLLAAGARVNQTAPDGSTGLTLAIASNHEPFAMALLEEGADPNSAGAGYTALHAAVQRGYLTLVKALLSREASLNARLTKAPALVFGSDGGPGRSDLAGATPLIIAARAANAAMVRVLVATGADPLLTTNDGTTPLMVAAGLGQSEDSTRKHFDLLAASAEWEEARAADTIRVLLQFGIDVNAVNELRNTALHGAAYVGGNSVVRLLVDAGANLDAQDGKGQTPFRIAEGHQGAGQTFLQYPSTAELLRSLGANPTLGVEARTQFLTVVGGRQ